MHICASIQMHVFGTFHGHPYRLPCIFFFSISMAWHLNPIVGIAALGSSHQSGHATLFQDLIFIIVLRGTQCRSVLTACPCCQVTHLSIFPSLELVGEVKSLHLPPMQKIDICSTSAAEYVRAPLQ